MLTCQTKANGYGQQENSYKYATQGGKIKRIIGGYNANFIKTQHNDFSFIKQDSRVAENKSKARKHLYVQRHRLWSQRKWHIQHERQCF